MKTMVAAVLCILIFIPGGKAIDMDPQTIPDSDDLGYGAGVNSAGTFGWSCFGSPVGLAVNEIAGGCAAATAFAADAEFSKSFFGYTWKFEVAVSVAACGGGMYSIVGIVQHAQCNGVASVSDDDPTFDCTATGGILSTPGTTGCIGASAAAGSSDCAQASATGHASNMLIVQQADISVSGTSSGCGDAAAVALFHGLGTESLSSEGGLEWLEVPPAIQQDVRDDLTMQAKEHFEAQMSDDLPPMVQVLIEGMQDAVLEEIENMDMSEATVLRTGTL